MNTLKNGRFKEYMATTEEVIKTVKEIKALVTKYHWEDKKFFGPYGEKTTVGEFINNDGFKNFNQYSFSSKGILISELNGFIEYCINPWEKLENEPKIAVKNLRTGIVKEYPKSIAEEIVADELGIIFA